MTIESTPPTAARPTTGPASSGTQRRPTGAIPAHWTVPAEVSASAVTQVPKRAKVADPYLGAKVALLVVVVLVLGAALTWAKVLPVPPAVTTWLDETELFASTPPQVAQSPTVVRRPVSKGGEDAPGSASRAPENAKADDLLATEPTLADATRTAVTMPAMATAQDAEPEVDDADGVGDVEARSESLVMLEELPVRRKVRGLIEQGEAEVRKGRYKTAAKILERAGRLDPNYPRVQRSLGIARARLGDFEGARKAYERYLELDPGAPDAADVRRILGQ